MGPVTKGPRGAEQSAPAVLIAFVVGQLAVAALLGVHNLWRRRVDWRGAARLSGGVMMAGVGLWFLAGHHHVSPGDEFLELMAVIGIEGFFALICVVYYVAL